MKKLILTVAVALGVVVSSSAQEAGQMWVGGSVGFSSTSVKDGDDYTNFKIMPEFGYVVNDQIGVGINIGFEQTELDMAELEATGKLTGFSVAPFVRYSAIKGNIGGIFIDGGVGLAQYKNKDYDTKATTLEVGFRPGVSLNVADNIALTAKFGFLGYQNLNVEQGNSESKINSFGLDLDLTNCLFGVNFVF